MFGFTHHELAVLKALRTPAKIQDFLERLEENLTPTGGYGDTLMSPRRVLRERKAHCIEGALLAAVALRLHGDPPLLVDLKSTRDDFDHVIAVFKRRGCWGCISKTNHAVLRYREPVYRNLRELAMSFFHEYFLDSGKMTLRSYSRPVNVARFDRKGWMTSEQDLWYIAEHLDAVPHHPLVTTAQIRALRKPDPVEVAAGKLVEWRVVRGREKKQRFR